MNNSMYKYIRQGPTEKQNTFFKYIRQGPTEKQNTFFWQSGIMLFCIYLAASFPGTSLFGGFPILNISLYLLIIHGTVTIVYSIRYGICITEHLIWYGLFTLFALFSLLTTGQIINNNFHSIIICFALTAIQSIYIIHARAFKIICWCYIIVCLINTVVLILTNQLALGEGDRLGNEMGVNPNVLATYLMYGVVYAIWLFLNEKNKKTKFVLLASMALIIYPLILTGGRKFFVVPIVFLGVYMFFNNDSHKNSARIRNLFIFAFVFIALWYAIMNIPILYDTLGNRFEGLLNSYTGKGEADLSTWHRGQLRKIAIQGWLESPIWGHGFDTFKYCSLNNGLSLGYSHCNLTELLYNGGLILFISYYWFFGMMLWRCFTDKSIEITYRAFCISGIVMQVIYDYGGVSYNVYQTQLFVLMMYCCMKGFKGSSPVFISKRTEDDIVSDYALRKGTI